MLNVFVIAWHTHGRSESSHYSRLVNWLTTETPALICTEIYLIWHGDLPDMVGHSLDMVGHLHDLPWTSNAGTKESSGAAKATLVTSSGYARAWLI